MPVGRHAMESENIPAPFRFLKADEFASLTQDEALRYLQRAVDELKRPLNLAGDFPPKQAD
jgi:hypothetical protein